MNSMKEYKVTGIDDVERTDFMFSDFPSERNVNPKHWESKLKFWKTEIEKSCRFYGDFCINCETLRARFRDNDGRCPKGMMTVVGDLYQTNELHTRSSYIDLIDDTWGQWTYNLAKQSSLWVWRRALYGGYNEQTMFVLLQMLEESASALLNTHYKSVKYEKTDNIVPWNVIRNIYKVNGRLLSEDNLTCVIGYLKNQGRCKVGISDTGEKIVKFKSKEESTVQPVEITDFQIIKLKKSIAKLQLECTQIEKEVKRLQENAQALVKGKDKEKAKKILTQKKKINKNLQVKLNALFGMKEQLRMVQDAESTKMIADAFSSTASLLNQQYQQKGLTVDNIDDVIDKAAEANEMIHEVDEALSSGLQRLEDDDLDIDELEKELEGLTAETLDVSASTFDELPEVPALSPSKSDVKKTKVAQQAMPAM